MELYVSRHHEFDISKGYNKIKLKERLLVQFPEAKNSLIAEILSSHSIRLSKIC